MNDTSTALSIIGSVCAVLSITFCMLTFTVNRQKDSSWQAKEYASIATDISYIKDGISELKTMVNAPTKEQTTMKTQAADKGGHGYVRSSHS